MCSTLGALLLCVLGQAANAGAAADAPHDLSEFVDPDVLAIVQVDLARANLGLLIDRVAGNQPGVPFAAAARMVASWAQQLREAGATEVDIIVSLPDLPNPPLVVVPLGPGARAEPISDLLRRVPIHLSAVAAIKGAVVGGTPQALERLRGLKPAPNPRLEAALKALSSESCGVKVILLPSKDTRRVLEELVPEMPQELGGGSITDLTRGVNWLAVGLCGQPPAIEALVAAPDAAAAQVLVRRAPAIVAYLEKAPRQDVVAGLLRQLKGDVDGPRIRLRAEPGIATRLSDVLTRPIRESSARTTCINNEKQIALAMHNFANRNKNAFPPAYLASKDGKPLLSWRVMILPFLEQEALYKEFHLDEPWDSPHNKTLIGRMPRVYLCPTAPPSAAQEGKTRYLAPRAAGTIIHGAEPMPLKRITDGFSNTILFIDAGDERAVPWTKPDDWDVSGDDAAAFRGIFGSHRGSSDVGGIEAALGDGSVRFLPETIKRETLRKMLTATGGEHIPQEEL